MECLEIRLAPAGGIMSPVSESYGQIPLSFEANAGQTDEQVQFLARGSGYALFLTPDAAVFSLRASADAEPGSSGGAVLRMQVVGGNTSAAATGQGELAGRVNYLLGSDPSRWRTDIPTYARVMYDDVYDGIDLVYYGNQQQLEYDFLVAPGADPGVIGLGFAGADGLEINAGGELVISISGGQVRQHKPVIYQEVNGVRRDVAGGYELIDGQHVGFSLGTYDINQPLVIDPILAYSTYLGGSNQDRGNDIAVDAAGSAYVTGSTISSNFPTTPGAFDTTVANFDAFVTKLNPSGSSLVYSTYLGGSDFDVSHDIVVDASGSAYVTGETDSADFPTTPLAFDTSYNGNGDAFVTKLSPTGSSLNYSTYLGGSSSFDLGLGIAVDAFGSAFVTGYTDSADFPITPGAFDTTYNGNNDIFVTKLNPAGSAPLAYSTYLGGSDVEAGNAIAVDAAGSAYVTGYTFSSDFPTTPGAFDTTNDSLDAFVTKLNPAGSAPLAYSTYLGGTDSDQGQGIAVDASGSAYVTGYTDSTDFPTTPGAFDTTYNGNNDAFVTKLNPAGSAPLAYSTYLGGSNVDQGQDIAVDAAGSSYVTGDTTSIDFPTTPDAFDTTANGNFDAFMTRFNAAGSAPLIYSTYLGGSGFDVGYGIAVDAAGSAYLAGDTQSANFPTTPGAFDTSYNGSDDAFVTKISFVSPPATLTLNPPAATNPVDSQHCVTATVQDVLANPVPDVTVRFMVTGSVNTSGSATTDSSGQATFCYNGPPLPGADAITAYADTDNDSMQDPGEPTGAATKVWVLPVSTPSVEVKITEGGRITALNGDTATFGGNARSSASGETDGQEQYQDHGPAEPLNVHSINVLAVVLESPTQASIYGQATIDGAGSFFYRIRVQDLAEPGVGQDTYEILLATGYYSGQQILEGGNVQIHQSSSLAPASPLLWQESSTQVQTDENPDTVATIAGDEALASGATDAASFDEALLAITDEWSQPRRRTTAMW